MSSSWLSKASLAVVAGLAVTAAGAADVQAGSLQLGNSGWTASWDASQDSHLALAVDSVSTDAVYIEKFVTFHPSDFNESGDFIDPVVISFQHSGSSATPYIVLNDEILVNRTGSDWNGFKFTLLSDQNNGQSASFDTAKTGIGTPTGFTIDPFTTHQYSQDNTILNVGGGTIPAQPVGQNVWFPGTNIGGLVIDSAGNDSFTLKEQPTLGTTPPPAIPLPAAAWSGLSGLVGLALLGSYKRSRRQTA
jgi:hypothetical protein